MAELLSEALQVSPGVFLSDSLLDFSVEQAWEKTTYQNTDYFGNLGSKDTLWQVRHNYVGDIESVYEYVVLRIGAGMDAVPYKMASEQISELRHKFEDDAEAMAALDTLQQKADAKENSRIERRNRNIGKTIVENPNKLHMLVSHTGPEEGSRLVKGLFGTLVGLTHDDSEPVIIGKDGIPSRINPPNTLWLYRGTLK